MFGGKIMYLLKVFVSSIYVVCLNSYDCVYKFL